MNTVKLTGKAAIDYVRSNLRPRMDESVAGLTIAGNEVDGDGVDDAMLGNAIDACDEDAGLVTYTLDAKRANAEFVTMAETAAECYGKLVLEGLEDRTATVKAHGETVHTDNSTPCGLAAARVYAAWDAEQIDWSEIIPEMFWDWSDEIKTMSEQAYYDWMDQQGAVVPAKTHELAALSAEAAGL
jgi:hypothetical protein